MSSAVPVAALSFTLTPKRPQIRRQRLRPGRSYSPPQTPAVTEQAVLRVSDTRKQVEMATRFEALMMSWLDGTRLMSSLPEITAHPAYQEIIRMGHDAVPFILRDLERHPRHWGPALHAITGAHPVPKEHSGRVKAIAADWLEWAKVNGYVW